jgi:formylglycine-generating enzyme required for sulfatase activity
MVKIPAGKFRMGHSRISGHYAIVAKPVHTVTIAKPFAMSKYEVTFEEYDRFTAETGRRSLPDKGWGRGRHPALRVPRADVIAYTEWLSTETGKRYRLPSEAEWEYAARGGTKANFWWGDSPSHEYANYGSGQPGWFPAGVIEGRDRWQFTAPVGSFRPNPFGLYDMNGNLWEHVLDCFHDSYKEAPVDGSARMKAPDEEGFEEDEKIEGGECTNFVMRGGSWGYNPNFMMSATRIKVFWGVEAFLHYGIRLVRELD